MTKRKSILPISRSQSQQLSFDYIDSEFDPESSPLPLLIAHKWGFVLQYHVIDDQYWYSPIDWIAGLIGQEYASQVWRNNLRTYKPTIVHRRSHEGRRNRRSFVTERTLYELTLKLRFNTPQVLAFKDYFISIALSANNALLTFELERDIVEAKSTLLSCQIEHRENPRKGYIYFVKSISGSYKIGKTKNLESRLHTFQVKLPFEVTLEMAIETDDMAQTEYLLHQRFADKRINGEWFMLTDDDLKQISMSLGVHHITGQPLLKAAQSD